MPQVSDETIKTYRYVRISMVGAVVLLFVTLFLQIARDQWDVQSSISAYYYLPVRSVFVGTLVGAAFSLVAIHGRRGGEDVLLNLAGMLLPLVAFVPTPVTGTPEAPCPRGDRCIPEEFLPGVEVSVAALLIVGSFGLAFASWTLKRKGWTDPAAPWGLGAAYFVWAVFAVWFGPTSDWGPRERLLDLGHYAAAIPVFALIVAVAFINARKTEQSIQVAGRQASYKVVYRLVALGMAIVLVAALAYWFIVIRPDPESESSLVFWVEAWLLALFAVFWSFQTREFWYDGLPEEARQTRPGGASRSR